MPLDAAAIKLSTSGFPGGFCGFFFWGGELVLFGGGGVENQSFLKDFVGFFFWGGELVLLRGGVENASAVSLFKRIFFCFIGGGGVANFGGGGIFPSKRASRKP